MVTRTFRADLFCAAVNASTPLPATLPAPPCEVSHWFSREIQPHEPALRAYLRGRFPKLNELDDVVQETFIRVLRAKAQGNVRSPKSLLLVTGRNVAFDFFRKRTAIPEDGTANIEILPAIDLDSGPGETLARKQELQLLDEAVKSLPAKCREIIMLQKFEGLSYEKIEQRLGITRNTISAQITIGVMKCRDYLLAHGVTKWERP